MSSVTSSTTSISDLFRPRKPKGLKTKNLSTTRLNLLKKEIQTDLHLKTLRKSSTSLLENFSFISSSRIRKQVSILIDESVVNGMVFESH